MEGTAEWSATGLEHRGKLIAWAFDSSTLRQPIKIKGELK